MLPGLGLSHGVGTIQKEHGDFFIYLLADVAPEWTPMLFVCRRRNIATSNLDLQSVGIFLFSKLICAVVEFYTLLLDAPLSRLCTGPWRMQANWNNPSFRTTLSPSIHKFDDEFIHSGLSAE